jgi:hypothetical protein
MDPEITGGQLWIKAKIRELVEANEALEQAIEWEDPAKRNGQDFAEGTIGFVIWTGRRAESHPLLGERMPCHITCEKVHAGAVSSAADHPTHQSAFLCRQVGCPLPRGVLRLLTSEFAGIE